MSVHRLATVVRTPHGATIVSVVPTHANPRGRAPWRRWPAALALAHSACIVDLAEVGAGIGRLLMIATLVASGTLALVSLVLLVAEIPRRAVLDGGSVAAAWVVLVLQLALAGWIIAPSVVEDTPWLAAELPLGLLTSVPLACVLALTVRRATHEDARSGAWVTLAGLIGAALPVVVMLPLSVRHDPARGLPRAPIVEVHVGEGHGCSRHVDGAVMCWGANDDGQRGDGTVRRQYVPSPTQGLEDAVALAVEGGSSCARRRGGDVVCWGRRDRVAMPQLRPTRVMSGATAGPWIVDGLVFAIDGDGRVHAGRTAMTPLRAPQPAVALAIARRHACALGRDRRVRCWGQPGGQPRDEHADDTPLLEAGAAVEPPGLGEVTSIVASAHRTCALRPGGTVACWGVDALAADDACRDGCSTPGVADIAGLDRGAALTAGDAHICALDRDGRVSCWGANHLGQLGAGDTDPHAELVEVVLPRAAVSITASPHATCATLDDGEVRCWGASNDGSLGVASTTRCIARALLPSLACAPSPQPLRWQELLRD